MPFLSEAPAGRSTVSMTEVAEMNTGSEMSCLLIDFLRIVPLLVEMLGPKDEATGVVAAEIGGVELAENGAVIGDG
jgi:hypothetical protein